MLSNFGAVTSGRVQAPVDDAADSDTEMTRTWPSFGWTPCHCRVHRGSVDPVPSTLNAGALLARSRVAYRVV